MRALLILLCVLYVICQLLWISLMFCFWIFQLFIELLFCVLFCLFLFLDLAYDPCFCFGSHFASLGFHPWLQFLVFGQLLLLIFVFRFLFMAFTWLLLLFLFFTFCFWLSLGSHFSLLSFIFCLWVKAYYSGPKLTDVVFIISHFHNVKLESLFQNHKHSLLKLRICGFQKRPPSKSLHIIYILNYNLKFINVWISRIKSNN